MYIEKSRTLMALAITGAADCRNARATSFPATIVSAEFIYMTISVKLMRTNPTRDAMLFTAVDESNVARITIDSFRTRH
jgi:hypothetical protein